MAFMFESVRLRRRSLMTDQHSGDSFQGAITTEETFNAVLSEVVMTAVENGLDPQGGWVCRNGASASDMEVMITELADGGE